MNFEDTIVSEISQSQKTKNCMIAHLYKVLRIIKFIEIETIMVVTRDSERGIGQKVQSFSYAKRISLGELLYNRVLVVNNTTLHT